MPIHVRGQTNFSVNKQMVFSEVDTQHRSSLFYSNASIY
jgi:hypothetical protein